MAELTENYIKIENYINMYDMKLFKKNYYTEFAGVPLNLQNENVSYYGIFPSERTQNFRIDLI